MTVTPPHTPGRRSPWRRPLRALMARPRLLAATAVGAALYLLLPAAWVSHASTRALLAWNGGAVLYLALTLQMTWRSVPSVMQARALKQDEGRLAILLLVVLSVAAVVLAVGSQLMAVRSMQGPARQWHVALAALTVLSAWLFTHVLFALHYAHDFYLARLHGHPDPLVFPGTADPDYSDFFHFACVIGTSAQTADVSFNGRGLRGVGSLHCVLAFFFNTTLLALTVNIAAGLLL